MLQIPQPEFNLFRQPPVSQNYDTTQPPINPPFRQPQSVPTTDDDTEDQFLRQAIEESLKGQVPPKSESSQKSEDELLQEAIQASLEGHKMQIEEEELMKQVQEESQREHEAYLQRQQELEAQQRKQQAPELEYQDKVDSYVIGDQDRTTNQTLVTRLQLLLPSGKREVVKMLKATPLIVVYALVRKKLAAENGTDPAQVPAFTIVNVNKPLENIPLKTLADAGATGSSLMITYD